MELGLLRKEDQHLVKSLSEALPVPSSSQREEMEEVLEQEKPRTPNYLLHDNQEQYGTQSPCTFSYVTGVFLSASSSSSSELSSSFVSTLAFDAAHTTHSIGCLRSHWAAFFFGLDKLLKK